MNLVIEFQHVSKRYQEKIVLDNFDAKIKKGEFFVLVGPSGSGKTTTLKMINRLIEPTEGTISLHGKDLTSYHLKELRLSIGYVLQQIALFPNLTVAENIELIPEMKRWKKEERRKRAIELLKKVNLAPEEYLQRKPSELSGGEQQRIGILRAIAAQPDVILMDEPFSALDPISRNQLQELIKELHHELKSTIVFVTHDMNEAMRLGERICVMKEGKVVQLDTPEQIRKHPADAFVAQFFQQEQADLMHLPLSEWFDSSVLYPTVTNQTTQKTDFVATLAQVIQALDKVDQLEIIQDGKSLGYLDNALLLSHLSLVLEREDM